MENKSILLEKYTLFEAYFILSSFYGFFKINNQFITKEQTHK
mgnify:FL=1